MKKLITKLTTLLIAVTLSTSLMAVDYSGGSGTVGDPYQIASWADLLELSTTIGDWGAHFIQTANIDASASTTLNPDGSGGYYGFFPIGNDDDDSFDGSYDGQEFTIDALYINRPEGEYIGLFGKTGGATIENIGLTNIDVSGSGVIGGLIGSNSNTNISNCYVTGIVSATGSGVGGLLGTNYSSTITNCYTSCSVTGDEHIGGLIGRNSNSGANISYCYNLGNVTGASKVGGLVGFLYLGPSVTNCYNSGNITGSGESASNVGGLVGSANNASISDAYNTGSVNGVNITGGLAGDINSNSTMNNCYSTGSVTATGSNYGGLLGANYSSTVTNSFWDTETSGQATSASGTGKATAEMKTLSTFTDAGWDFVGETTNGSDDDWSIDGSNNSGYPWLSFEGYDAVDITWDGSASADWNEKSNWSLDAVPTVQNNPIISSGVTQPVISTTGTASCNNLTVNSGASLTIQSDANSTGSLIVEGTATGDVSVERYIAAWTGDTDGWHCLSSPIATFTIDGSEFDPGDNDDVFGWEESTALWMNHKSGDPTQIEAGTGYLTAWEVTDTKIFSGTLNNSDITKSNLSFTESSDQTGWHLLGNPFPSALLWDATAWSRTNVNGTAKIWNESGASYTDIAKNDPIPATQGFMIYVSSATNSITIPLADRSHNSQNWYKNTMAGNVNKFKLTVYDTEGGTAQESIIKFNENATSGFDSEYDCKFLPGYAPQFYSATDDGPLSTNTLSDVMSKVVIPMSFIKNASSSYYINGEGVNNLEPQETVYLTDLKLNHTQILNDNPIYAFTSQEGDIAERFVVHFNPLGIEDIKITEDVNVFAVNGNVEIRSKQSITAIINIYNISGQLLSSKQMNNESSTSIQTYNYKGAAIVTVVTSGKAVNKKVIIW